MGQCLKNCKVGQPVPLKAVNMYIECLPKNILGEVTVHPNLCCTYLFMYVIFLVPCSICTYLYIVRTSSSEEQDRTAIFLGTHGPLC